MGTKTLRINDIGMATLDLRRFGSRSLMRRFRDCIENSDWDERLEDHLIWVNGVLLTGAAAGLIFIVLVAVRIVL